MEFIIRHIKLFYRTFILMFSCLVISSCTEQYAFQTQATFESLLVVQANITNELKKQEIKLTRTYRLEENGPTVEKGATVYVTDNDNNTYEFEPEEFSGLYVSKKPFQAVSGKLYKLNITTKDGKSYSSANQTLTPVNDMQIETKVETIDGEKGVQIVVSSYDPSGKSQFYRFEYEETYKVVAPYWIPKKLIPAPGTGPNYDFLVVPRDNVETRVCYTTKKSDDLILISNVGLSEDRINLPIRFIDAKNPILNQRYSIIVREYTQNLESYTYYKTLKSLSTSTSLFSQVQPGFNYGNITSNDDSSEKIIGYFEVSPISSKRIFFNFRDIFVTDPANFPPYQIDCTPQEFLNCWGAVGCGGPRVYSFVTSPVPDMMYYANQENMFKLIFVPSPCSDCTKISSNIKPLFWID